MYVKYNARSNKIIIKGQDGQWRDIVPGALLKFQIKELIRRYCSGYAMTELEGAIKWLLRDSQYAYDILNLRQAYNQLSNEAAALSNDGNSIGAAGKMAQAQDLIDEGTMLLGELIAKDVDKMKFVQSKAWLMREDYNIKVNALRWFKTTTPVIRDLTRILHDFSRFRGYIQQELHIVSPAITDKVYVYRSHSLMDGTLMHEYRIYPEAYKNNWDEADNLPVEYI